jgi:phosphoserine aminotransferase
MLLLTLQWLKNLGGVAVIEKLNNAKAALLYEIDRNPLLGAAALKIVLYERYFPVK